MVGDGKEKNNDKHFFKRAGGGAGKRVDPNIIFNNNNDDCISRSNFPRETCSIAPNKSRVPNQNGVSQA